MEEEKFQVSKNILKTLTVDTRTNILKALEERPMTASELSRYLNKHVTTVSEHLDLLKDSELVERVERPGRKWIYYKLTKPGQRVLHPESYKWIFVLSITFICFICGFYYATANSYPGNLLYNFKRTMENLQLSFTADSLKKAELHIQHANERLEETKQVVNEGKTGYVSEIIKDYNNDINQARLEIQKAKENKRNIAPTLEILSESTAKQSAILENIVIKNPTVSGQVSPALNISKQEHNTAVQELVNITERKS